MCIHVTVIKCIYIKVVYIYLTHHWQADASNIGKHKTFHLPRWMGKVGRHAAESFSISDHHIRHFWYSIEIFEISMQGKRHVPANTSSPITNTHTHTHTNANDAKAYKIHASTRGKCMPHVHKLAHTCTLEHACYYTHTHTHVHTWMSGSASMTSGARFLAYHGCIEVCDMLRIGQNRIYTVCDCRFGE